MGEEIEAQTGLAKRLQLLQETGIEHAAQLFT